MRKPLIHLLFWMGFFFIWNRIFYFYMGNPVNRLYFTFLDVSLIAAAFYGVFIYLMPLYLKTKRMGLFLLSLTALVVALSAFYSFIMWFILQHNVVLIHFRFYWTYKNVQDNRFFIALLGILAGFFVKLGIDRMEVSRQMERMAKEKSLAELTYLKAQINPHFLFNSLNSLYAQMEANSVNAKDTLVSLADLLRYQLYDCNTDWMPVEKEIAYLKNYFNLQSLRKDNCRAELFIEQPTGNLTIAPLLLIPFVENAFKYVSDRDDGQNFIKLTLNFEGNKLHFNCSNTTEARKQDDENNDRGIGLVNVKKRLELIYGDSHQLQITSGDDLYRVDLAIILK